MFFLFSLLSRVLIVLFISLNSSSINHLLPYRRKWISQGFCNGLSIYSAAPVMVALLKRKRVDESTWRTAVGLGCFVGGYRLGRQLFKHFIRKGDQTERRSFLEKYENFICGAFGSALGLSVDDHFLGSFLVIWWVLRAVRCALPVVEYSPTVIMCLAASIINPSAFLYEDEHQKAYQKFMNVMALGVDRSTLIIPQKVIPKPSIHGWNKLIFCDELQRDAGVHPTSSCTYSVWRHIVPKIFYISLRMYGPLYLAWQCFKLKVTPISQSNPCVFFHLTLSLASWNQPRV